MPAQQDAAIFPNPLTSTLRVSEIFFSLQGEATRVGLPTVFIRLTGCPLRCVWCATRYAFTGGETLTLAEILDKVRAASPSRVRHVCVTGGEPLAQKNCLTLLTLLCDAGYDVAGNFRRARHRRRRCPRRPHP